MSKGKVLIVDDNPANLRVLLDYLERAGFEVLVSPNGERVLRQFDRIQPDLILMDVLMPGLDGFETCRRLKEQEASRDVPVIFMTALSDMMDKLKGFDAGGVDYLTKPLQYQEVIMRVNTHLKIRRLQEQLTVQNLRLTEQNELLEEKNVRLQREIAERVHIEESLKETITQIEMAKREWETTADSLAYLVCLLDAQGGIIRANRTVEHWKLSEVQHIKGQTMHDLLHDKCSDSSCYLTAFLRHSWAHVATHQPDEYEGYDPLLHKYLNIQVRPISEEPYTLPHISGSFAVCTVRDITERKRVEQALQQRTRELYLLNTFSDSLQRCQSEEETYNTLVHVCRQLLPDSSGSLLIMAEDNTALHEVAYWGNPPDEIRTFGLDDSWIFDHDKTTEIEHPAADTLSTYVGYSLDRQCLCIPINASGELLAILSLDLSACSAATLHSEAQHSFESSQLVLIGVVEHYAVSLVNLRLRETLRKEAIIDPLTGLFNRRHMEAWLTREVCRAQRRNTTMGIIMLDVDHFKVFNDTYGHDVGDVVLQELGKLLQRHIRAEDIACRYGGEEFLLILPEASLDDTKQRAEELRIMVQHLQIRYQKNVLGITISLGIAALPEHGLDTRALILAADKALYKAKTEGRNRVSVAAF